jgi:hypothetical protein
MTQAHAEEFLSPLDFCRIENEELLDALRTVDAILRVPAAEYVPAIRDAWDVIDAVLRRHNGIGTPSQ